MSTSFVLAPGPVALVGVALRPRLRRLLVRVFARLGPDDLALLCKQFVHQTFLASERTSSIGNEPPQSQCPPPQEPRSECWQTPLPEPCACVGFSLVIGIPNAEASSAIQRAQFSSMSGCLFHSAVDQLAKAQSSAWTATGLAFAAVQALLPRFTYSPIVPALSSIRRARRPGSSSRRRSCRAPRSCARPRPCGSRSASPVRRHARSSSVRGSPSASAPP